MSKIQEAFPGLRLIVLTKGGNPPWNKMQEWQKNSHYYRCRLAYRGRQMTFDYWTGMGFPKEPQLPDVMNSLALDALQGGSFNFFCYLNGCDECSRKDKKIWQSFQRQNKKLERLFGDDYQTMLSFEWEG
jgi:hypothetical protein